MIPAPAIANLEARMAGSVRRVLAIAGELPCGGPFGVLTSPLSSHIGRLSATQTGPVGRSPQHADHRSPRCRSPSTRDWSAAAGLCGAQIGAAGDQVRSVPVAQTVCGAAVHAGTAHGVGDRVAGRAGRDVLP
jgi:hypothetical protein